MKEWNPLENQLRSWTPRAPSAKLRARLFPASDPVSSEVPNAFDGRWAWLAPVMGCFLVLMVLSGRTSQLGCWSGRHTTNWLATVASNPSYAAYIEADFHSEQNALQREPLEWTNAARLSSEPGPGLRAVTNSLIQ